MITQNRPRRERGNSPLLPARDGSLLSVLLFFVAFFYVPVLLSVYFLHLPVISSISICQMAVLPRLLLMASSKPSIPAAACR